MATVPFNPFTPKSDQFQFFSPAALPENYTTQYEELGFSQMRDDYTTNSLYLTYAFIFKRLG